MSLDNAAVSSSISKALSTPCSRLVYRLPPNPVYRGLRVRHVIASRVMRYRACYAVIPAQSAVAVDCLGIFYPLPVAVLPNLAADSKASNVRGQRVKHICYKLLQLVFWHGCCLAIAMPI